MAGFTFLPQEAHEARRSDVLPQKTKSIDYTFIEICIIILTAGVSTNIALIGQKISHTSEAKRQNALISDDLKAGLLYQNKTF